MEEKKRTIRGRRERKRRIRGGDGEGSEGIKVEPFFISCEAIHLALFLSCFPPFVA